MFFLELDYLSSSHQSISAIRTHCPVTQPLQFRHVTLSELEITLKSLEPKKATGHDNIPPKALCTGAAVFAYPLSILLNKIIDSGKVPTEWKLAEICPVFKKNDAQDKAMYRPVSILVVLDKVFEKCLERQLIQYFNLILSPSLSAYRRGYSCESVLLPLIEDWRFALDKRCVVGAVIMDLSKAFDMIPHNLLLAKLAAYGISSSSLVLLQDYLRGRSQRVKIEDVTSDVLPISKGVPQGSVLGPLFFNIFLNDLFYVIKRAKLSNYADDNQIYFCDRDPQVVKTVINDELALACKWFDDNKLVLNPTKCKALVLSNKHPLNLNFTINDVQIPCVDHLELLGVVIDNSLHFDKHITKITKKVGKQLDVLCRFKKMLSSSTKLCLYNSFIMSYFTYCSTIWHNCMKSDSDRLDKLNERALRYIYSDQSSTYAGESTEGTSYTLADRRIQDMLILVFKAVNNLLPTYLSDLFIIRENIKNLRGTNKLVIPNVNTTRYGTKSVTFTAPKAWNSLPDRLRSMKSLKDFKIAVRSM